MARPRKRRHVCLLPEVSKFGPLDTETFEAKNDDMVIMSVEEYETIRLIDQERLTQEECAKSMGVARSTIQRIYDDARKKLADTLINGKVLKIRGGDYELCGEDEEKCGEEGCCRRRRLANEAKKTNVK